MAKSAKGKTAQKSQTRVTRISTSEKPQKYAAKTKAEKPAKKSAEKPAQNEIREKTSRKNPLHAIANYFKGSWEELKQVRWPDRATTWGMVGALLAFTLALFVVIILLDYGFALLFKLIMGTE